MTLLHDIHTPADLKKLGKDQLPQVAEELRHELIDAVSVTGGHFGAGLGVIELTTALHYVFNTPADRIIWDVSHQAYPHKILTGRRDQIRTIRKAGGLSGFTKRSESEYDPFGAAHSSTSISAALGMAVARDLTGGSNHVIAVIASVPCVRLAVCPASPSAAKANTIRSAQRTRRPRFRLASAWPSRAISRAARTTLSP